MELSRRLGALVRLAEPGSCAADVGCDHGYAGIYLAAHGIFQRVVAMDVRKGPLEKAERNIALSGMSGRVETRLSDGMRGLGIQEADTLFCAGMGGELVVHILSQDLEKARRMKQLILQPQSEIFKVRKYLRDNGFVIVDEDMVFEDGKYYQMMRAVYRSAWGDAEGRCGTAAQCDAEAVLVCDEYGPVLLERKHPVLYDFLLKEKKVTAELLDRLRITMQGEERGAGGGSVDMQQEAAPGGSGTTCVSEEEAVWIDAGDGRNKHMPEGSDRIAQRIGEIERKCRRIALALAYYG